VPIILRTLALSLGRVFIVLKYFVIVGTSNAVNINDGWMVWLFYRPFWLVECAGSVALSYGEYRFADYLLIPYVHGSGELLVFCRLGWGGLGSVVKHVSDKFLWGCWFIGFRLLRWALCRSSFRFKSWYCLFMGGVFCDGDSICYFTGLLLIV